MCKAWYGIWDLKNRMVFLMNGKTLRKMVFTAMMAAFVFVATYFLKIRIPTPTGYTMLKMGNILCVLSGLLFGPLCGGLAAGIGSALYDLTDPVFAASAPTTFVRFFIMGFLAGLIAHMGKADGQNMKRNLVAAIVGAMSYVLLYIGEKVVVMMLAGSGFIPAVVANSTKLFTSLTNAVVAIIGSMLLVKPIGKALQRTGYARKD